MTGLVQRRYAVDGTDRCGSTGARGTQRVAAFAIDDTVIAAYIGLLTGAGFASRALLHQQRGLPRTDTEKIHDHAVAFLTLTLPVALYVALSEASRAQATFGKRAQRLRVTTTDGQRVPLGRSLVRAAVKFAPWELAHTALWQTPGQPFVSPPGVWNVAGHALALGGAAWYAAALFVGDRRTPYDHIAGTTVVEHKG